MRLDGIDGERRGGGYDVGRVPRLLAPEMSRKFRERGVERFVFDLDHYEAGAKPRRNVFYNTAVGGSLGNVADVRPPAFFPAFYAGAGNDQRRTVAFFFNASLYSKMQFRIYRSGSSPGNAFFQVIPAGAFSLLKTSAGTGTYTQTKAGAWDAVTPFEYTFSEDASGTWRVAWGGSNDNVYVYLLHVDLWLKNRRTRRIGEENFL